MQSSGAFVSGLALILGAVASSPAEEVRPVRLVDLTLYPYQRSVDGDVDGTLTINADLPGRLSYFSYVNVKGATTHRSLRFDRSEQNLRFAVSRDGPFDLNWQSVLVQGNGNDFYQLGMSWRVTDTPAWKDFFGHINLALRTTVYPKRWGGDNASAKAWGLEHFFRLTFPQLTSRLYLVGFYDKSFKEDLPDSMPSRPVVTELQLGVQLWRQLYLVGEYRVNERRVGNETNFAAGLEYKFRW